MELCGQSLQAPWREKLACVLQACTLALWEPTVKLLTNSFAVWNEKPSLYAIQHVSMPSWHLTLIKTTKKGTRSHTAVISSQPSNVFTLSWGCSFQLHPSFSGTGSDVMSLSARSQPALTLWKPWWGSLCQKGTMSSPFCWPWHSMPCCAPVSSSASPTSIWPFTLGVATLVSSSLGAKLRKETRKSFWWQTKSLWKWLFLCGRPQNPHCCGHGEHTNLGNASLKLCNTLALAPRITHRTALGVVVVRGTFKVHWV